MYLVLSQQVMMDVNFQHILAWRITSSDITRVQRGRIRMSDINITPPPSRFSDDSCEDTLDVDPKTKVALKKLKEALKASKEQEAQNNNSKTMSECDLSHIQTATPDLTHHQITFSANNHTRIQNSTPVSRNLENDLSNQGKHPCPKCGKYFKRVSSHLRFCKGK